MNESLGDALKERIDIIEETYEYMLAYAAQGLSGEDTGGPGAQLRDFLIRCHDALEDLSLLLQTLVDAQKREPAKPYHSFIKIVEQDAQYTQTALQLVLVQPSISSQLIDNLNAWIHLRALLTDLFVIDEILQSAYPNAS
jgi:hypothetical protein